MTREEIESAKGEWVGGGMKKEKNEKEGEKGKGKG
jgi:hypothetical protein